MKILLVNVRVYDQHSKHHLKVVDLLVEGGKISRIGKGLSAGNAKTYQLDGKLITPGLVDMCAHFNEPGYEHKEDLGSGIRSAVFSGFTEVCVLPNTDPVIESKSDVKYIRSGSREGVTLHVIAAASEGTRGENLTEILDLQDAGAVAFSDGLRPIWNSELLLKALQYVSKFDGLIISRPKDPHLAQYAQMHEGPVSTSLGLKGEPAISEEVALKRDLDVLKYAGGRIHFSQLSSAGGVDLVKRAKKEGLKVTCDVAIHQLLYTEDDLSTFDSNYKVDPPFRTEKDRKALIKGLQEGVIDAIVSAHQPQDSESKALEFDLSENGVCSLPTFFSNLVHLSGEVPMEILLEKVTHVPRRILGLAPATIEEGGTANLALFDPELEWHFDAETNPSKSVNSPQYGQTLKGRCVGIVNGKTIKIDN